MIELMDEKQRSLLILFGSQTGNAQVLSDTIRCYFLWLTSCFLHEIFLPRMWLDVLPERVLGAITRPELWLWTHMTFLTFHARKLLFLLCPPQARY